MKNIGFTNANILLPKNVNMKKWSVVACDQFTGQPEYWEQTAEYTGANSSTLHMILPECYLEESNVGERIDGIHDTMKKYLSDGVFSRHTDALIYIERTLSNGRIRRGLVGALDLEQYDFSPDASTLCRATEQTVASRIPPRKKVREGALLEAPHVLVLIDDPKMTVIEALGENKNELKKLYDFDLMQNGGHIKGYAVSPEQQTKVWSALETLCADSKEKYGTELLYLVGDGNHSLATAKACYEDIKAKLGDEALNHPARYALVELVNLQSDGILFEPIHRVLYNIDKNDLLAELQKLYPTALTSKGEQSVRLLADSQETHIGFDRPAARLAVGTLQQFLDDYIARHPEVKIDYIHEDTALIECCKAENSVGFLLPAIEKNAFFESIIRDGVLPRKTFSMGDAADKRYYLECRQISK